jgi:hypothetical protein
MRVVEQAGADRQQVAHARFPDQLRFAVAQPGAGGGVHLQDQSIRPGEHQPAGGMVEQAVTAGERVVHVCQRKVCARKASIARELSVGALMCGQWPTLSITCSVLAGRCRCR